MTMLMQSAPENGDGNGQGAPKEDRFHRQIQARVKYRVVQDIMSGKMTVYQAMQEQKVSRQAIWLWKTRFQAGSLESLVPGRRGRKVKGYLPDREAGKALMQVKQEMGKVQMENARIKETNKKMEKEIKVAESVVAYLEKEGVIKKNRLRTRKSKKSSFRGPKGRGETG